MQVAGADFEKLLEVEKRRQQKQMQQQASLSEGGVGTDVIGELLKSYPSSGLQSSKFGEAERLLSAALLGKEKQGKSSSTGSSSKKIYLAYTSNLISSGLREVFAAMVKAGHCDAIVTTAGGIEEDYIKCLGPTMLGDFALPGVGLRQKGLNRVGNLLIPNNNYVEFEDFMTPTLKEIHKVQRESHWQVCTTPSDLIQEIGLSLHRYAEDRAKDIKDGKMTDPVGDADPKPLQPIDTSFSVGYWASQKQVPVFCPALTDGSIGDMVFFYNFSNKGLIIDPVQDLAKLHDHVSSGRTEGEGDDVDEVTLVVLGGGLPKHHLMRAVQHELLAADGCADEEGTTRKLRNLRLRVINVSTALSTDGSVSAPNEVEDVALGFLPDQSTAACDGGFHVEVERVSMHADATLIFPLLYSSAMKTASTAAAAKVS